MHASTGAQGSISCEHAMHASTGAQEEEGPCKSLNQQSSPTALESAAQPQECSTRCTVPAESEGGPSCHAADGLTSLPAGASELS